MGKPKTTPVVLAVAPVSRGIGYCLFENPQQPLDWGVKHARINKETTCQRHVESLISFYQPDILILEQFEDDTNRKRVVKLNDSLAILATCTGVNVERVSHDRVKGVFSRFGSSTKFGIAKTITQWLPEFKTKMPKYRKIWMSEDHSMALFEAAALALTYYYTNS